MDREKKTTIGHLAEFFRDYSHENSFILLSKIISKLPLVTFTV
jgi:hypothetical protein